MKSNRHSLWRTLAVTLGVFALLFSVAVFLLDYVGNASDEAQTDMINKAVHNAVLTCYAVEGVYPANIEYLVENYGLAYDESRYLISYEAFASNVFPDIRVNIRGGE